VSVTIETKVRLRLYREFIETGHAPSAHRLAEMMGMTVEHLRSALERLAAGKAIVLQPASREVLIAAPFSAVPTPFLVQRKFFGSCIWDAMGILAMLKADGAVETSCACCGEAMSVQVRDSRPQPAPGIVHFAIPARKWWENIVFT
jgi:hypothetical protein